MTPTLRKTTFSLFILFIAIFGLPACKSKKEASTKSITPEQAGEVEVKLYCSGPEFFSSKEILRANAVGESMDQNTSKKKALNEARTQLASSINTVLKATIDNYVNSREFNNREEVQERFEGLSREVINQELSGTRIICEKLTRTPENTYKTYLALELSGTEMLKNLGTRLGQDERLRIDYDYEKFKNTFDQEMEKFERSRR